MLSNILNNRVSRLKDKDKLIEQLEEYRGILNLEIYDCLNSLIELEFSALKNYISDGDRKALSEIKIYNSVVIYNIYHRVLNLFNNDDEFNLLVDDRVNNLSIYYKDDDRNIKLFDFDYMGGDFSSRYSMKNHEIGKVDLFQTIENKVARDAEMDRIMKNLERLYDQKNPYPDNTDLYGGPSATWAYEHMREVEKYEKKFQDLDSKKELSLDDKKEIEVTSKAHDLLSLEFGIDRVFDEKSLKALSNEDKLQYMYRQFSDGSVRLGEDHEMTELQKTYIKRMPNLTIKDNIKYV